MDLAGGKGVPAPGTQGVWSSGQCDTHQKGGSKKYILLVFAERVRVGEPGQGAAGKAEKGAEPGPGCWSNLLMKRKEANNGDAPGKEELICQ